jgi:hypothetical protein
MRTTIPLPSQLAPVHVRRNQASHRFLSPLPHAPLAILAAATALFAAQSPVAGQTPTPPPASTPAQEPLHPHKRPSPAHPLTPQTAPASVTPPAAETPDWPANNKPAQASVVWDSQGLRIDAANSSLEQILKDVSTATGTKVEGLGSDQRVFGAYGPGQARDVLSLLLQGSGYNVIMMGDQGQGAPRQILLSVRQAPSSQPGAKSNQPSSEEDTEPDEPPQQEPQPGRPGFPPGTPPRSPQQIQQEMQQRQQELQLHPQPTQPQIQPVQPQIQPLQPPNSPQN